MAKLTKEERIDSRAGYQNGRKQAERGCPWAIATAEIRSDLYKESHRRGYLAVVALGNFPEPKPKREKKNSTQTVAEIEAIRKIGYEEGFMAALKLVNPKEFNIPLKGRSEWSDRKTSGYQRGYRQAIAGHKPNASGDLQSDPEFNDGYQMGHRAGSRSAQELQTA